MEKLLNDQLLDYTVYGRPNQQLDLMTLPEKSPQMQESEIEKGNLQDYLEIYGELEDN
ncbi:MAG: hypothetical protein ACERKD_14005 [Prolixibacteraceae bacterium]